MSINCEFFRFQHTSSLATTVPKKTNFLKWKILENYWKINERIFCRNAIIKVMKFVRLSYVTFNMPAIRKGTRAAWDGVCHFLQHFVSLTWADNLVSSRLHLIYLLQLPKLLHKICRIIKHILYSETSLL